MTWSTALSVVGVSLNFGCLIYYWVVTQRLHRTLDHAQKLDAMLSYICLQAFAARHVPIWSAWSGVMGEFEVEIKQNRRMPESD